MITFGLTYGVNAGLPPRAEFEAVVAKAWTGLCTVCLQPDFVSLLPNAAPVGTKYFGVQLSSPNGATLSGGMGVSTLAAIVPLTPWQQWQSANFTPAEIGDPAISGPLADRECDGIPNILRYAFGTLPGARATPPSADVSGSQLILAFIRNTMATDTTLTVQGADSPAGPWANLARSVGGSPFGALLVGVSASESASGTVRNVNVGDAYFMNDPAHPRRFMRLQAGHP